MAQLSLRRLSQAIVVSTLAVIVSAPAAHPPAHAAAQADTPLPIGDDYPIATIVHRLNASPVDVMQCGMFAMWRVDRDHHRAPMATAAAIVDGRHNAAKYIDDLARAHGYQVDATPTVGSVGVIEAGERGTRPDGPGHAFYVARVYWFGLLIEQYNWHHPLAYSVDFVPRDWARHYVHF